jgi:TIR domain
MADRLPPHSARAPSSSVQPSAPVAFLSYAHEESTIAKAFRDALGACGLRIIIDVEHAVPGEDIVEFARRSIRAADVTICLVSTASLSSTWVVFEAVSTLQREHIDPEARLIACATDRTFFDHECRLRITKSVGDRLTQIDTLLLEYLKQQLDFADLASERSRLISMRASLGEVLAHCRNSLTLELREDNLVECATKVADHIRRLRGLQPSRGDPRDIRARAEELRRHLWEGRTEDALDRMLDFVREFSDRAKHVRDVTSLSNTLRRIDRAEKEGRVAFAAAEEQRQPTIYKLLELIDEIEVYPQLPVAS